MDNVLSGRVSEQSAGCKINEGTVTEEEKELVKKPCEFCGKKFADGGALKGTLNPIWVSRPLLVLSAEMHILRKEPETIISTLYIKK